LCFDLNSQVRAPGLLDQRGAGGRHAASQKPGAPWKTGLTTATQWKNTLRGLTVPMLKHGPSTGYRRKGPEGPCGSVPPRAATGNARPGGTARGNRRARPSIAAARRGDPHGHSWSFPAQPVFGPAVHGGYYCANIIPFSHRCASEPRSRGFSLPGGFSRTPLRPHPGSLRLSGLETGGVVASVPKPPASDGWQLQVDGRAGASHPGHLP